MRRIFVSLFSLIYANIAFAYITNDIPNGCSVYSNSMRPVFEINEYTCSAGYYLPANGIECAPCRAGYTCGGGTYTFNPTHEQGIDLVMYSLVPPGGIAGCDGFYGNMRPVFEINEYTCGAGYYLPANGIECAPCRAGYTCGGGTYTFNPTHEQGIELIRYNLVPPDGIAGCDKRYANMYPVFKINEYTCGAGYYLPANGIECVICPADSYCPGGHYVFNETLAQGITACATGLYAPTGMWQVEQCGRILHIGENVLYLRSTKKTAHALHFAVDGNGGLFFANATTADVPMHAETDRRLKIKYNDVVYSIYDDTVVVPE